MPRTTKKVVASKVTIHACGFTKNRKVRQTDTHHAFETTAKDGVIVSVDKQYPRQDFDFERPPKGTIIEGDSADISARKILKPGRSVFPGMKRTTAEGNVQAVIHTDSEKKVRK